MWNTDLSTAQKNSDGCVAIRFMPGTEPLIELGKEELGTYRAYKFSSRNNICMAWVTEEDAPKILAMKHGCCGNKRNNAYCVASSDDVRRWTYGGR